MVASTCMKHFDFDFDQTPFSSSCYNKTKRKENLIGRCLGTKFAIYTNIKCDFRHFRVAEISVTSPIVINMPTREILAGETKNLHWGI